MEMHFENILERPRNTSFIYSGIYLNAFKYIFFHSFGGLKNSSKCISENAFECISETAFKMRTKQLKNIRVLNAFKMHLKYNVFFKRGLLFYCKNAALHKKCITINTNSLSPRFLRSKSINSGYANVHEDSS